MTRFTDDIEKLDAALCDEVAALIKRAIASLPTDDAITFLDGMHEEAWRAMEELEDKQSGVAASRHWGHTPRAAITVGVSSDDDFRDWG